MSETARHLGLNAHMLGGWKREFDTQAGAVFPGNGRMASDQAACHRLRDDHKRLRMARDILKKALGFFASGSN